MTVMEVSTFVGKMTIHHQEMVLQPHLILRDTMRGAANLTNMPQQQCPQTQIPSQAYVNYAMGLLQVGFSFRVEAPKNFLFHVLMTVLVFMLSCSYVVAVFTYGGSTVVVCNTATLWSLPLTGIFASW